MSRLRRALVAFVLLSCSVAAYTVFVEPGRLVVRETTLALPHWSHALDGLKIVLLSDLHVGSPRNGPDRMRHVVEVANEQRPDLVLLAGDYVIHDVIGGTFCEPETIAAILADLRAPLGVYAVLGNHDWWLSAPRVRAALEAHRIAVIDDRAARLAWNEATIYVAGISDFWEGTHDVDRALAQIPNGAPTIALTHNPDVFPSVPARVALTLAGHTHGGQVNLPLLGRLVVPSAPRYAIGHVVEDGKHLFVTPGVGTSILPVRFRVAPEVTVLVLRAAE